MIHDPERERLRTELRALLDSARGDTRADLKAWEQAKDYLESLFRMEDAKSL